MVLMLMLRTRPAIASSTSNTTRTTPFLRFLLVALILGSGIGSVHAKEIASEGRAITERQAAERLLMQGRIDEAVAMSQHIVSANPKDGQAYLLLCRSFYAEEREDEAIAACENAVQALPRSSDAQDWLGRAYGMKANRAGPITGFTLARKVKVAFETAVALDPGNGAAAHDLGEFYIEAPSVVGGGEDKALALADHVAAQLPQEAHWIRGRAAEERKDYGTAEREFKEAIEVANRPDAWVDLGAFYRRRAQKDKAVDALKQCLTVDRTKDASIVDAASLLDRMHREPQLAEQALRQYLGSNAKNDEAPAIKVHVMLGKLLASNGDKTGAKIEFDKSLTMASNYAAAKQALQKL
jgi:tetratricopeptide (TPR) repeat protein